MTFNEFYYFVLFTFFKLLTHQFNVCKLQLAIISQFSRQFVRNVNSKVGLLKLLNRSNGPVSLRSWYG